MTQRIAGIFAALAIAYACLLAQPPQESDAPLARVGNSIITRKEFVSRYELAPMLERAIANQTASNKTRFLLSMIAEKLLVHEAVEKGLTSDSLYLKSVNNVERSFVRDELFRREVSQKIEIPKHEIEEAIRWSQVDYKVYFLFAATKDGAESLMQEIRRGKKLEEIRIARDTTTAFEGPDSANARWGEMDERMEKVIYGMKLGQTSAPILLDDGYYIVKIMGKSVTVIDGDKQRKDVHDRVERILRKRKEDKRMFDFMAKALKAKKANANASLFRDATTAIASLVRKQLPADSTKQFVLTGSSMDSLRRRLSFQWDSTFVMLPKSTWTLGETLEKMSVSMFTVQNPTPLRIRRAFDQRLRDLIDQEHLTQQGYDDKLNLSDAVCRDLTAWREYLLADRLRQAYLDTVGVTPLDWKRTIDFYHANREEGIVVKLRHIVVDSAAIADEVFAKLQGGTPFVDLMERYSTDEASLRQLDKEDYLLLSSLGELTSVADSLDIGAFSRPIATANGYEILFLTDRKYVTVQGKDSLLVSDAELRTQIRKEKLQRYLTLSLANDANKTNIEIYWKNLETTEVTRIPSMVYRYLGFGGRMFATPFLNIQLEWIEYLDKKRELFP